MLRRSIALLLTLILCASLAFSDATEGTSVVSTKYFDVIYPAASAETAALIAEAADGFADEICALLETEMKGRIPVYIDPTIQVLNAHFSPSPYNRIYLYDTVPTDGSIAGFRDSILMVFYHELTHAISLNVRTPFWQAVSEIFADSVSPNFVVTMPLSFAEGVTVSFESRVGEGGRLNDPLTAHYVRQDKIEGKFLSWKEASGALDVYPGAKSAYLYGGAFSAWLQATYGMEKYAELWRRGGGFNPFLSTIEGRFKQVYRVSLSDAWAEFEDSVPVPANLAENDARFANTGAGIYTALAASPFGVAWMDSNAQAVYFLKDGNRSAERLFDADSNVNRLSLSPDGRFLLVSGATVLGRAIRQDVRVYDMDKRRFLSEGYQGLRDASFSPDGARVCAVEVRAQRSALVEFRRGDAASRRTLAVAGPGERYGAIYNPVFAGDGSVAYVGANGLERDLVVADVETGVSTPVALPSSVQFIRYLQSIPGESGVALSFSWANADAMYRYAIYSPRSGQLLLQDKDYSGGVFFPVPDAKLETVRYVASLSGRDELRTLSTDTAVAENLTLASNAGGELNAADGRDSLALRSRAFPANARESRPYSPLPWFLDGEFIPWPVILPIETGFSTIAPGFIYATGDPSERYTVTLTPAFSLSPFFADLEGKVGIKAEPCAFLVEAADHLKSAVFDFASYRESSAALTVSRDFALGTSWRLLSLSVAASSRWFAPDVESSQSPYGAKFRAQTIAAEPRVVFSAMKKRRIPEFPLFAVTESGFAVGATGYYGYHLPDRAVTPVAQGKFLFSTPVAPLSVSLSAAWADGIKFGPKSSYPSVVCVRDFASGMTRYIPLFPEYRGTSYEYLAASSALGLTAELTPLTLEIQKGLPILPLYANRAKLVGGYRGAVFNSEFDGRTYVDSAYCRASFDACVVIGILSEVVLSGSVEYAYPLREGVGNIRFGFTSSIEF